MNTLSNSHLIQDYSNFKFLGIGKETEKQKERRKKREDFRDELKETIKKGGGVKVAINRMQVFNPAAFIPRAGVAAGFRLNFAGLSTRLYPAFLTDAELKSKNMSIENAAKARDAWKKVSAFWFNLGGNPKSLEKYIKMGHNKPVFKTKRAAARKDAESSFDGEEWSQVTGYDDAAIIVAGLGLLGSIAGMVAKSQAAKNPYTDKSIDTSGMDVSIAATQAEIDKIKAAADADKAKGLGLDDADSDEEKFLGMPKTTGIIVAVLGTIVIGTGIYLAVKHFNK